MLSHIFSVSFSFPLSCISSEFHFSFIYSSLFFVYLTCFFMDLFIAYSVLLICRSWNLFCIVLSLFHQCVSLRTFRMSSLFIHTLRLIFAYFTNLLIVASFVFIPFSRSWNAFVFFCVSFISLFLFRRSEWAVISFVNPTLFSPMWINFHAFARLIRRTWPFCIFLWFIHYFISRTHNVLLTLSYSA